MSTMLPCGSGDGRKSCLPLWKSEHNSFDRDRPLTAAQCESSFTAFWGNADLDFQRVCFIRWPSRVVLPRFGGEARSSVLAPLGGDDFDIYSPKRSN
mmetsp:Transcript_11839/g.19548  ORF Transcript_11839/g.19548 Transcript_11839/m.19548 type:complete len:97 (+) Transcript_11839:1051-1341(+)